MPPRMQLRLLRWNAGLSQVALAERAGISRQSLVAIEGGTQRPQPKTAKALADQFGLTVEELFGEEVAA